MAEMLDTFGTPEYFITETALVEDAGFGNLRLVQCIRRNGVLVPVYSVVQPLFSLAETNAKVGNEVRRLMARPQQLMAH